MQLLLTIVFLFCSLGISGFIYYACQWYRAWYYCFIPLLFIPIFFLLFFGLYIGIIFFISLFMDKKKTIRKPNPFWYFWIKQTAFLLIMLSRTKVQTEGLEQLNRGKRYLVVSNHISTFDPMLAITRLKLDPLICVTKKENLKIPICGSFIHHAGFIPLDRRDSHSAVQMVKTATEYLKENQSSIYICPEGTRSKTEELLPFHPGSFKIAKRAGVEIAVCYIEHTNQIVRHFPWKRTRTAIRVLSILSKEDVETKTTQELAMLSQTIMQKFKENKR